LISLLEDFWKGLKGLNFVADFVASKAKVDLQSAPGFLCRLTKVAVHATAAGGRQSPMHLPVEVGLSANPFRPKNMTANVTARMAE